MDLLRKYISGIATDEEKEKVVMWIKENDDNFNEYMRQRRLYDIEIWTSDIIKKDNVLDVKKKYRKYILEFGKIAAIVALTLAFSYYTTKYTRSESDMQSISVPAGQRAELLLSDGTKVWVNSMSTLYFPSHFDGDYRTVKLDGEAYFDVTTNKNKPFIVETNKYNVKVLGTEFNIIAYSVDSIWETSLIEGRVEVMKVGQLHGEGVVMRPNTKLQLVDNKLLSSEIENKSYYRWCEGLICFNDISVPDLFRKFERYFDVKIVLKNKNLENDRFTGKLRTCDGIEHALKVLKMNRDFSYTRKEDTNTIIIN